MNEFRVGERVVVEVHPYNWEKYMANVPYEHIPDMRCGKIVSKRITMGHPVYIVRFSDGRIVECDGVNIISAEAK